MQHLVGRRPFFLSWMSLHLAIANTIFGSVQEKAADAPSANQVSGGKVPLSIFRGTAPGTSITASAFKLEDGTADGRRGLLSFLDHIYCDISSRLPGSRLQAALSRAVRATTGDLNGTNIKPTFRTYAFA